MIGYMFLCAIKLDVLGGNTGSETSGTVLWRKVLEWTTEKLLQPLSDRNRINLPPAIGIQDLYPIPIVATECMILSTS